MKAGGSAAAASAVAARGGEGVKRAKSKQSDAQREIELGEGVAIFH